MLITDGQATKIYSHKILHSELTAVSFVCINVPEHGGTIVIPQTPHASY